MKFQAFIFDMDGTIIDNMRFHNQTWVKVLATEGIAIDIEYFSRRTSGKQNPEILREFVGSHLSDAEIAEFSARKEVLYRELYRPHVKAIDGLEAFLKTAQNLHIPMALATSADKVNINFTLTGLGLETSFNIIVGGEDITHSKPHPEIFLTAAQKLDVAPGQCLVFEDAPSGIEAAQRAGMQIVALATTLPAIELAGHKHILRIVPDYYTSLDPAEFIMSTCQKSDDRQMIGKI
jgi:beta-phosphoglucomutase family hydrolase